MLKHGILQMVLAICPLVTAVQAADVRLLYRTPISETSVAALTDRWLLLNSDHGLPLRAWAGLMVRPADDPVSPPLADSTQQLISDWQQELADPATKADRRQELIARIRHARDINVRYLDSVLLEYSRNGSRQFVWQVDSNLDGDLSNDTAVPVETLRPGQTTARELLVEVSSEGNAGSAEPRPRFRFVTALTEATERSENTDGDPSGESDAVEDSAADTQSSAASDRPAAIPGWLQPLVRRLKTLDEPAVRKQNLDQIVTAADAVIHAIDRRPAPTIPPHLQVVLADVLYRKGRALGYHELPDVIARNPIQDPEALDAEFERTFARLDQLVDTTQPEYILLRIRCERRRDNRGTALNLVGHYRDTHPNPVWHYKKRFDLLRELELPLHAHQAAAELWLDAAMPRQPVPVVFRLSAVWVHQLSSTSAGTTAGATEAKVLAASATLLQPEPPIQGDWISAPPWRSGSLTFRIFPDGTAEAVVWLDTDAAYRLRNAEVADRGQSRATFQVSGPTVLNLVQPGS